MFSALTRVYYIHNIIQTMEKLITNIILYQWRALITTIDIFFVSSKKRTYNLFVTKFTLHSLAYSEGSRDKICIQLKIHFVCCTTPRAALSRKLEHFIYKMMEVLRKDQTKWSGGRFCVTEINAYIIVVRLRSKIKHVHILSGLNVCLLNALLVIEK